jgi:hypothetical protein
MNADAKGKNAGRPASPAPTDDDTIRLAEENLAVGGECQGSCRLNCVMIPLIAEVAALAV